MMPRQASKPRARAKAWCPRGVRLLLLVAVVLLSLQAAIELFAQPLSGYLSGVLGMLTAQRLVAVSEFSMALFVGGGAFAGMFLPVAPHSGDGAAWGLGDYVFLVAVAAGVMAAAAHAWSLWTPGSRMPVHLLHQCYLACLSAAACLMLTTMSRAGALGYLLCLLLWSGSAGVLVWYFGWPDASPVIWLVWQIWCAVILTSLLAYLGLSLLSAADLRAWVLLALALSGWAVGIADILRDSPAALTLGTEHHALAVLLALVWMMLTGRIGLDGKPGAGRREASAASVLAQAFAHSGLYGFGPSRLESELQQEAADLERRRIAQELHDGVGSQLVGLLAGLDRSEPRERELASSLEQSLLELKILVDAIDDADETVSDALGRLRYRVQPSLDRLGMRLIWRVALDGSLDAVRKERSRQVLRIAQESLANAMRHSQATEISLRCECDRTRRAMVMEVRDNGVGADLKATAGQGGKGLEGMRRRAAAIGGVLEVSARADRGTRVRLTVPL